MKSNKDRVERKLQNINDAIGLAMDDFNNGNYKSAMDLVEEIMDDANYALRIMEENEEFQNSI